MVASLDHFIKKRVMKKIFLIAKRSRLEVKKTSVQFLNAKWPPNHSKTGGFVRFSNAKNKMANHSKTGHKLCPKNDHSKTGQSGFGMLTVYIIYG